MQRFVILGTRGVIVFFLALSLVGQIMVIPFIASDTARVYPEFEHLKVVGIIGCVLIVACVQVSLLGMWRLLTLVRRDVIFDPRAFRIVDVITGSFFAVAFLAIAGLATVVIGGAGHPGVLLLSTVTTFGAIGLGLLMMVMKELLRKATTFAQDLSEVI